MNSLYYGLHHDYVLLNFEFIGNCPNDCTFIGNKLNFIRYNIMVLIIIVKINIINKLLIIQFPNHKNNYIMRKSSPFSQSPFIKLILVFLIIGDFVHLAFHPYEHKIYEQNGKIQMGVLE